MGRVGGGMYVRSGGSWLVDGLDGEEGGMSGIFVVSECVAGRSSCEVE